MVARDENIDYRDRNKSKNSENMEKTDQRKTDIARKKTEKK